MRVDIVHPGAGELWYEIRGIVAFANKLEGAGLDIIWENIGDPVAKGEVVPQWVCDIVANACMRQEAYAYSPTKGLDKTRAYIAKNRTEESKTELKPENIMFFNGLGDAITKVYTWLNPAARVLGPSPAYQTHSSVEGAHGRSRHLTYDLNYKNNWLPDIEDVKRKVKDNPNIAGLLLINPDNPTGTVYPREVLQEFVSLAKEYNLFLIADEIYAKLTYPGVEFVSLSEVCQDVPTIVMRGLSKEVPWPGSRCGWLEYYNLESDPQFKDYIKSIEEAKMIEVCSTTLPQYVLPEILSDARYTPHLKDRTLLYQNRATQAAALLNTIDGIRVVCPRGAFYLTVVFEDEILKKMPNPKPQNLQAAELLKEETKKIDFSEQDKLFCYQLLASTGLCVVPLSTGFNSHVQGFRMTLLESDPKMFALNLDILHKALT